jgi:uncharacterized protein (DUF427 family)
MSTITETIKRWVASDNQARTGPGQAVWNGVVLAESDRTVVVQGNLEDVNAEYLDRSERHSTCFWKGTASYYDVVVHDKRNQAAAWHYPQPSRAAAQIKDRVAFWHGVKVSRAPAA